MYAKEACWRSGSNFTLTRLRTRELATWHPQVITYAVLDGGSVCSASGRYYKPLAKTQPILNSALSLASRKQKVRFKLPNRRSSSIQKRTFSAMEHRYWGFSGIRSRGHASDSLDTVLLDHKSDHRHTCQIALTHNRPKSICLRKQIRTTCRLCGDVQEILLV